MRLGVDALCLLGYRAHQALPSARNFRRQDEDALVELAALRHDHKGYMSRARQRIPMLEDILQAEHRDPGSERDAGWDVESLRHDLGRATDDG